MLQSFSDKVITAAGHCSADPVAASTDAAIALDLGLCAVLVCFVLQGTFCRNAQSDEPRVQIVNCCRVITKQH